MLQNEFFKIQIDEKSGGVRSIQQHSRKTNLVGQQLAIRLPKDHASKTLYADMVADSRFEQTVRIVRGINRIEFNVKLEPIEELTANREHYICSRLAWKSEGARLIANVLDSCEQVANQWFHATQFVTIKETDAPSVSMLTGGLPFHRRANRRMLDSVLMICNESRTNFSFALAIDQPYTGKCYGVSLRLKETESRAAELTISASQALQSAEIVKFNGEVFSTLPLDEADNRRVTFSIDPLTFLQVNLYFQT